MSVMRFHNIISRILTGRLINAEFSGRVNLDILELVGKHGKGVHQIGCNHLVNNSRFLFLQKRLRVNLYEKAAIAN